MQAVRKTPFCSHFYIFETIIVATKTGSGQGQMQEKLRKKRRFVQGRLGPHLVRAAYRQEEIHMARQQRSRSASWTPRYFHKDGRNGQFAAYDVPDNQVITAARTKDLPSVRLLPVVLADGSELHFEVRFGAAAVAAAAADSAKSGRPLRVRSDDDDAMVQVNLQDGAKNASFEPFLYRNDHFTKTGSGQT